MGLEELSSPAHADHKVQPLPTASQRKQKVSLSHLINKLNRLNFKGEPVLFHLQHRRHEHIIAMHALPQPCADEELECIWLDQDEANNQRLQSFDLVDMTLSDGQHLIRIKPKLISVNGRQITVQLPQECTETSTRAIKRHTCTNIRVSLTANSATYQGQLLDFNAFFVRVQLKAEGPETFDWVSDNIPTTLTIFDGDDAIFSGECQIVRHTGNDTTREYVLQPARYQFPRYRAREHRSERRELLPNLNVVFTHPATRQTINLPMADLSGTGFSLLEPYSEATLLPGMILKNVGIHLTSRTRLSCTVQVVHRTQPDSNRMVKAGLALLDIAPQDHLELISLLQQAKDPESYVSHHVDTELLWDFFFESGFITPDKYTSWANQKELFKQAYPKLYSETPEIARHFIHMAHGKILGHFGLLRLHSKTWLLNHHTALAGRRKYGLLVLERLCEYINDTHLLDSANNHYTAGFYRADNRFPAKYFGGMTEKLGDKKASSIDEFAYLTFTGSSPAGEASQVTAWTFGETTRGELEDLQGFYKKVSGGLLLKANDMTPEPMGQDTLTQAYANVGLKREIQRLSIRKNGQLKAIINVNLSESGINFSKLTNATQLFVVDSSGFSRKEFQEVLSQLAARFNIERFPLLVFPTSYMHKNQIPFDETYCFNVLNTKHWDDYMRYMRTFMKKAKLR